MLSRAAGSPNTSIHNGFNPSRSLVVRLRREARLAQLQRSALQQPKCEAARLQVVFVATEVAPWSKTGGLADVLGSLPAALAAKGHRVMTVSPRYNALSNVVDTGARAPVLVGPIQIQQQEGTGKDPGGDALHEGGTHASAAAASVPTPGIVKYYASSIGDGVDHVFVDHPVFQAKIDGQPANGAYTHGEDAAGLHVQARNNVLCQAALAAPVLIWLDQGLAASECMHAGGVPGRAQQRPDTPLTQQALQLVDGVVRSQSVKTPSLLDQHQQRLQLLRAQHTTGPASSLDQPRLQSTAEGDIVFVGNDWPTALMPLWMEAYTDLLEPPVASAVHLRHQQVAAGAQEPGGMPLELLGSSSNLASACSQGTAARGSSRLESHPAPCGLAAAHTAPPPQPSPQLPLPGKAEQPHTAGRHMQQDTTAREHGHACPPVQQEQSQHRVRGPGVHHQQDQLQAAHAWVQQGCAPPQTAVSAGTTQAFAQPESTLHLEPHGPLLAGQLSCWQSAPSQPTHHLRHAPSHSGPELGQKQGQRQQVHDEARPWEAGTVSGPGSGVHAAEKQARPVGGSPGQAAQYAGAERGPRSSLASSVTGRAGRAHESSSGGDHLLEGYGAEEQGAAEGTLHGASEGSGAAASREDCAVEQHVQAQAVGVGGVRQAQAVWKQQQAAALGGESRVGLMQPAGTDDPAGQGEVAQAEPVSNDDLSALQSMQHMVTAFQHYVASRLRSAKYVAAIHNYAYQGVFDASGLAALGLPQKQQQRLIAVRPEGVGEGTGVAEGGDGSGNKSVQALAGPPPKGKISWLQAAVAACVVVITVSQRHAREIKAQALEQEQERALQAGNEAAGDAGSNVACSAGDAGASRGPAVPDVGRKAMLAAATGSAASAATAGLLHSLQHKGIQGISNGIDTRVWDPQSDAFLPRALRYTAADVGVKKAAAKALLQSRMGLNVDPALPLFGFVGRLEDQKGVDVLLAALPQLLGPEAEGMRDLRTNAPTRHPAASSFSSGSQACSSPAMQVVMLGCGTQWLEQCVGNLEAAWPGLAVGHAGFSEPLAHLIMAGCDYLLVPSRHEPFGLVASCAVRYGTVPVVTPVGGLYDLVGELPAASVTRGKGSPGRLGFIMPPVGPPGDLVALRQAVAGLVHTVQLAASEFGGQRFMGMRDACMAQDVSWAASAADWERALASLWKRTDSTSSNA